MSGCVFTLVEQDGSQRGGHASLDFTSDWTKVWAQVSSLGVHVYTHMCRNGNRQIGFRFSNGSCHADGAGFRGRLYYQSLTVQVDNVTIRLVPNGQHVFPPRGILERRFTVTPDGSLLYGWSYQDTVIALPATPFGPARELFGAVNRAHYDAVFKDCYDRLFNAKQLGVHCTLYPWGTNGPPPVIDIRTNALGPWMPDGYPDAGAPAGYGIDLAFGWEQCVQALNFAAEAHECAMDRNPVAAYDIRTGSQITCTDWTSNYLAHGQVMKGEPAPQQNKIELPAFLDGNYETFHYRTANIGVCPYQAALEAYQPDNTEHVVRAMRRAASLVGWSGDPMAADDLVALFEYHRTLFFGNRTDDQTHSTDGSWVPESLSKLAYGVKQNPHHGMPVLRSFGWMMYLGSWALPRGPLDNWTTTAIDTYLGMCDKFGLPQREAHTPYMPVGTLGTQHFHSALIHVGAWQLARAKGYRVSDVNERLRTWEQNVLQNRKLPLEERPDQPSCYGPPKWIFTQLGAGEVDALTTANSSGAAETSGFQEHVLALLGRHAQSDAMASAEILKCGLNVDVPAVTPSEKLHQLQSNLGDQGQYAHYWAALERR